MLGFFSNKGALAAAGAVLFLLLSPACSDSMQAGGSKSNWMQTCDRDDECSEGLTCLCGMCGQSCSDSSKCELDSECSDANPLADFCEDGVPGGKQCLLPCSADSECDVVRADLLCEAGYCLPADIISMPLSLANARPNDAQTGTDGGSGSGALSNRDAGLGGTSAADGGQNPPDGGIGSEGGGNRDAGLGSTFDASQPIDAVLDAGQLDAGTLVGNGWCDPGEAPATAPQDCETANDGLCTGAETPFSIPADCPFLAWQGNWADISGDGSRIVYTVPSSHSSDKLESLVVRDLRSNMPTPILSLTGTMQARWGEQAFEGTIVDLSDDGEWVALETAAALVREDTNNRRDVYVVAADGSSLQRVSLLTSGSQSVNDCWLLGFGRDNLSVHYRCEQDIRFALQSGVRAASGLSGAADTVDSGNSMRVFVSERALFPADTNNSPDIYIEDLATGGLSRASISSDGIESNANSWTPSVSADGRFVAFASHATNLAPDNPSLSDIFVHDRVSGETIAVTVPLEGPVEDWALVEGAAAFTRPHISADGRFVVFEAYRDHFAPLKRIRGDAVVVRYIGDWVDSLPAADSVDP